MTTQQDGTEMAKGKKLKATNTGKTNLNSFLIKINKKESDLTVVHEEESSSILWNDKAKTIFHNDGRWSAGFNDNKAEVSGPYPVGEMYYIQYIKKTFPDKFKG